MNQLHLYILTLLFVLASSVQAEGRGLTVRHYEYLKAQEARDLTISVHAMREAFMVANATLEAERRKPLYCQPKEMNLTLQSTLEILDEQMKITARSLDTPISIVLLDGLKRTLPCRK